MNRSLVLISALGLTLGLSSAAAQAPAQSPPAAQAPGGAAGRGAPSPAGVPAAPGGRAGGGGGGRGAAGPSFTTTQLIALGTIDTPALIKAAADAATDLRNASLTKPKDVPTKAKALGDAELALALSRASAVSNLQASPDRLNAEQLASVKSNNGLNRGGNTSPGATIAYSDYTGFVALWDGKTFKNWDGETDVWSIDHDAIHADTTKTPGQHHLHYTGPGAVMKDFDFKVEVKMGGNANGGIQYRSRLLAGHGPKNSVRAIFDPKTIADPMGMPLPAGITTAAAAAAAGITGGNPWQMSGYQFDMNTANNYTGQLYEGQGRGIVTAPGQIVQLSPGGLKFVMGSAVDNPAQFVKEHKGLDGEWNQFEVIARGNTLIHLINGHVITVTIDDDPVRRASQGILSLQLEGSGQIWYRNVYLKTL